MDISATDGGSRPTNNLYSTPVPQTHDQTVIQNDTKLKGPDFDYNDTDFDYLALDIFDLLQNIILRDQVKVNIYNTTAQNCTPSNVSQQIDVNIFNTTNNWSDKSLQITALSITIVSILLNVYAIYCIATIERPIMPLQTYYATSTIDE